MGIQHAKKKIDELREICINEGFGVYIKARAVGHTRAAMIREGKIGFSDLVEPSTGRLYTIKELLKR